MAKQKLQRKIGVMAMLEDPEIKFLDRKIDKKVEAKASRSAILRTLIRRAMENPAILDSLK
jgi:hypothetical protein